MISNRINNRGTVREGGIAQGPPGPQGPPGNVGLPEGGIDGQVLYKLGNTGRDAVWGDLPPQESITLSGDVTGSGTNAIAITLVSTGVAPGTYSQVTVDAKGRVTLGANPNIYEGIEEGEPIGLESLLYIAAGNVPKKLSFASLAQQLKTYFDSIYWGIPPAPDVPTTALLYDGAPLTYDGGYVTYTP